MRTIAAAAILVIASNTAEAASKCYTNEDDPSWTVTVNDLHDNPEAPEMVWKQGSKSIALDTMSGGTGVMRRMAVEREGDADALYGYAFVDNALVLDWGVYRLGCK